MGFLDKITLARGLEKPRHKKSQDKTGTWRNNFEDYLSKQKAALKNLEKTPDNTQKRGKGKRPKVHTFWHEEEKRWVFEPRYGTKNVALSTDSDGTVWNQVKADSLDAMAEMIDAIIGGTKDGSLDAALAQAAARPRKSAAEATAGDQPPKTDAAPAAPSPTPAPATPASAPSGTSTRKNRS